MRVIMKVIRASVPCSLLFWEVSEPKEVKTETKQKSLMCQCFILLKFAAYNLQFCSNVI